MTEALVLLGRLVTFDPARPEVEDGALYIGADERIAAVQSRTDPAPGGFGSARRVRTGGAIYPGLIDLHSHVVYNVLPLWSPPGTTKPFVNRKDWPKHGDYEGTVSDPANALGALAGKAHLKYCEVKAVVGGTTAIQGSAKMAYPYEGWLVRNVEYETFKTGEKTVYQSALPLKNAEEYRLNRERMKDRNAFIYHLSEGTDPVLIEEYELARTRMILRPRFCGIHCTALGEPQFEEWERIAEDIDAAEDVEGEENGTIVWSPFSNLWLYRDTTAVVAARDEGMRVCLGSDWSPSGSKNLLGELKVADMWNRTQLGGEFSAEELCAMATRNPGDALGWSARIGRLKEGLHGDVLVTTYRGGGAYRNLIESVERDVELVAINGQPFYGTSKLMKAAGATHDEPIRLGRLRRRIRLVYPGIKDADMGWADALADIEEAKRDPVARYLEIEDLHEVGDPPPWLRTDKPWDDPAVTGRPVPVTVRIPPLDSLVHDAAYFRAVKRAPLHGGLLDALRSYYFPS
jgi:5-methylthioadenosine/S-adenosylhomocysteine deaminase